MLKLFPDDERALVMHGRVTMKDRDYHAALQSWQTAAAGQPENAHYHLQAARCHAWLKSPDSAVKAATRALQLNPALEEAQTIIDNCKLLKS